MRTNDGDNKLHVLTIGQKYDIIAPYQRLVGEYAEIRSRRPKFVEVNKNDRKI